MLLIPGAAACGSEPAAPRTPGRSRVALVRDPEIRTEKGLDAAVAERMVGRAVRLATGADDAKAGFKALFSSRDRVALKLNCLAGPRLSPTPAMVRGLVRGLMSAGVEADRIVVFERTGRELRRAGFTRDSMPRGVRVFGTDEVGGGGYPRDPSDIVFSGEIGSFFTRILTEGCTALVNVGVLKDHNLAGVSAGLKNLYGLIHNPNKYHDRACDPYVADVAAAEPVRAKLRLTICDATTAQCERGPAFAAAYAWEENAVWASTDPVALDRVAFDRIETERKRRKLPSLIGSPREPRWIRTAREKGLGNDDPDRFRILTG